VESTSEAYQASGIRGSQADGLSGLGDFLAVPGNEGHERTRFQAAYIGDYDLHMSLSKLYDAHRQRLLAQPFATRLRLPQEPKPENQSFSVNGGRVAMEEKQPSPLTEDDEDLIFGMD
jgi:hypothetical protein